MTMFPYFMMPNPAQMPTWMPASAPAVPFLPPMPDTQKLQEFLKTLADQAKQMPAPMPAMPFLPPMPDTQKLQEFLKTLADQAKQMPAPMPAMPFLPPMPFPPMMPPMMGAKPDAGEAAEADESPAAGCLLADRMKELHRLNLQMAGLMKQQQTLMHQIDGQIRETLMLDARKAFDRMKQVKKEGSSALPFGISPKMLQSLLKLDMSPENLSLLQKLLDHIFDRYAQAPAGTGAPAQGGPDPTIEVIDAPADAI